MPIKLAEDLKISRLIHGHWRIFDWNITPENLLNQTKALIDLGITTFDHADIYGNYECEAFFGKSLSLDPSLRKDIQIVSKCGIKLLSDKFPQRQLKYYDYSKDYIIKSVENSLQHFNTDYIDLILLHRPSPFFNPEEVAEAFSKLKQSGKVLQFGVSNFTKLQFEMLNSFVSSPLVTNQIEISPYCLEHFDNENIDFLLKENIHPMAWSPLAGGRIFNPTDAKGTRLLKALTQVSNELGNLSIAQTVYIWLLMHPSGICPIIGSGNLQRIKNVVAIKDTTMSMEQWFSIYNASTGCELP